MKLTWPQIETVLVAAYGRDGREAVEILRRQEGLLNQMNQCGDVSFTAGKVPSVSKPLARPVDSMP